MLRCRNVAELTTDYLEHELPWWTRLQIRIHVIACRHCRRYLRQVRKLVTLLAHLPSEAPPQRTECLLSRQFRASRHDQA